MSEFITLAVESSCDDTSIAVVADGTKVKSNIIASQLNHAKFGGVVPELAARCHLESLHPVYQAALEEARISINQVDLIAVTYGPGLIGSLLVGLSFAKGLAMAGNLPLIAVNHIEGHIYANLLENPDLQPPLMCLTVSGGHSDLLYIEAWGKYHILGRTLDDAAGEAFDKVGRVLGLAYPGGPIIDKLAATASPDLEFPKIRSLPGTYDFSFSGLKTAAINYIHQARQKGRELDVPGIAAAFQQNVVRQLTDKLAKAADEYKVNGILLSGGVAANSGLRAACQALADQRGLKLSYPGLKLCTDNAGMIAAAGYFAYQAKGASPLGITVDPNLTL